MVKNKRLDTVMMVELTRSLEKELIKRLMRRTTMAVKKSMLKNEWIRRLMRRFNMVVIMWDQKSTLERIVKLVLIMLLTVRKNRMMTINLMNMILNNLWCWLDHNTPKWKWQHWVYKITQPHFLILRVVILMRFILHQQVVVKIWWMMFPMFTYSTNFELGMVFEFKFQVRYAIKDYVI